MQNDRITCRPGVDHYYIKIRSEVPVTHPTLVYIGALKPHFKKTVLILLDRPVNITYLGL